MSANKQLLLGNVASGTYEPNAVKFDGANDYMTRGVDLTGLADSKSGIFSCWVRADMGDLTNRRLLSNLEGTLRFFAQLNSANVFLIRGYNSAGTIILSMQSVATYTPSAKWIHVLASWDLAATTSYLYVNDVSDENTTTITNDTIDYVTATPNWAVGSTTTGGTLFGGAISELYFAPGQYLDFSTESNRRKFIDADGLPVSLGSDGSTPTGVAPIIYLKGDNSAFGVNSGSGGNFTVNGTLEKASTTPATLPAYNAVDFDGSADYLTRGADLTGIADGKSGIFSAWIRLDGGDDTSVRILSNLASVLGILVYRVSTNVITIFGRNAALSNILLMSTSNTYKASGRWLHILASWDLAATTGHLYVNGVSDLAGGATLTNDTIDYVTSTPNWSVGAYTDGAGKFNGAISELYFAPNQYLDLSVQSNREKFILNGAPVSLGADGSLPTGTAPAIYLPNRAALVGTNAGSGGNFTINGAPKDANSTPVYYYAEPATFDGTNDYLTRGADLTGIADGKAGTFSCWIRVDGGSGAGRVFLENFGGTFSVSQTTANKFEVFGYGSSTILRIVSSALAVSPVWVHVIASWDLATTTSHIYVNNTSDQTVTTRTNDTIDYATATPNWFIGTSGAKLFHTIADLWFTTTYIDLSNSANRAKFIDQTTLRPVPLGAKGELPTGSQPLLYLGRDFSNFQTNLGSGGAFTVTGALTRGTTSPSDVRA